MGKEEEKKYFKPEEVKIPIKVPDFKLSPRTSHKPRVKLTHHDFLNPEQLFEQCKNPKFEDYLIE
jgi:hypothetical protein